MLTNLRRGMTRAYSVVNPKERRKREQAIADIAKEVFRGMVAIDSGSESTVASTISIAERYSTKTIVCIRDCLAGTGKMKYFVNYHTYVSNEKHLRIAAHYKDSGIVDTFSISTIMKEISTALGNSFLKRHPIGTAEYQTVLDTLSVAIGAQSDQPHIAKERMHALQAEGYMRWEAKGIVDTQMLNDGSRRLMTRELAAVIEQHPNRAQDIREFLGRNLTTPVHADIVLLDLYLSTESKAMAEGIL